MKSGAMIAGRKAPIVFNISCWFRETKYIISIGSAMASTYNQKRVNIRGHDNDLEIFEIRKIWLNEQVVFVKIKNWFKSNYLQFMINIGPLL